MLLVAGILGVPPIMWLVWFIPEFGDGVSVELLGLLCSQPTNIKAARMMIADSGIVDFISVCVFLSVHGHADRVMTKVPDVGLLNGVQHQESHSIDRLLI
jgi:hypothetical protein